jgi:hypothetical protein
MFFKSLINTLSSTNSALNDNVFNNVNPSLIRYFRNEYGADWKVALEHHLYKERVKNDKKVA